MRFFKFFQGDGSWRGYKATTALSFGGFAKTVLDNYWLFTSLPMAGNTLDNNDPIVKAFYFTLLTAANVTIYGGIGLGIDYLRSIYHGHSEEVPLLPNNQPSFR